jgi:hypothetical protein
VGRYTGRTAVALGDGAGVDGVRVVELGRGLRSGEGGEAEGDGGTHGGGWELMTGWCEVVVWQRLFMYVSACNCSARVVLECNSPRRSTRRGK